MPKQTVVRLARKKTGSIEATLEGILLNELNLANMDWTVEKKFHQWSNDTLLLWCGKVSECINLTALDKQIKLLSELLNFSFFSIDKVITNSRFFMTISIISPDIETLQHIHNRYYTEVSKLVNIIPIDTKNIIIHELEHFEFEAKLVMFF